MNNEQILQLIPKTENYIQYMLEILFKIPRTEKFNIGNEFKKSMYEMLENVLILNKTQNKIQYLNLIDTKLNVQRILLRILYKNRWIDIKKYNIAFEKILEIGKILGGLIKYYAKNNKK